MSLKPLFLAGAVSISCLLAAGCAGSACLRHARWIDRIEGDQAVLVDAGGVSMHVRANHLPEGAGEGMAVVDGRVSRRCTRWMIDELRRARVDARVPDGVSFEGSRTRRKGR